MIPRSSQSLTLSQYFAGLIDFKLENGLPDSSTAENSMSANDTSTMKRTGMAFRLFFCDSCFGFFSVLLALLAGQADVSRGEDRVDYRTQVKSVLHERCYACHGALKQEAGLRLDTAALAMKGGESGPAIKAGDVQGSLLLKRVTATTSERMPPEGEPLTPEQIEPLKQWIAENADAPADEQPELDPREHWAFRRPTRPSVPAVANEKRVRNPIDAFLATKYEQHGLTPQPEAVRPVLLRRLYLDLIGLPPTPEEILAFENDTSTEWYDRVVNRLLDDARYGERWARHWMDIWRYSDWWGLSGVTNSQRHLWRWRDWIVESLNADLPYDEMIRQMLAADELYPNDPAKLRATGFLARNWNSFNRIQWLDESVEHIGKAFLGLTMNCAKCHDHKYDPIEQVDYYKMRAFLETYHVRIDMIPGEANLEKDGLSRVFDSQFDTPTYLLIRGDEKRPDSSRSIPPGLPAVLAFKEIAIEPIALPKIAAEPERQTWVVDAYLTAAMKSIESAKTALAKSIEKEMAAREALAKAENSSDKSTPSKSIDEVTASHEPVMPADRHVPESAAITTAKTALREAELELEVAHAALNAETSSLRSVQLRAEASRLTWKMDQASLGDVPNTGQLAADRTRAAKDAARSEREVALAKARHQIAVLEFERFKAAANQKESVEKKLSAAKETFQKADKALDESSDAFTVLAGAQWSRTSFNGSSDAVVPFQKTSSGRRKALADWIADPRNPLTARVAVNQIWMRHMGNPLVSTVFDFGRKGNQSVHPELLDWLSTELMEGSSAREVSTERSRWSMKHLHRLIVTSSAYRTGSSLIGGDESREVDPDNQYFWRREPQRLEAEVIRDCILMVAGALDPKIGGPSVPLDQQANSHRRSLYFFHSDTSRNLFLSVFDDADVAECYRRDQSIVPQQSLALSNSTLVHDSAAKIAARIRASAPGEIDDKRFVHRSFLTLLGRSPDEFELARCETMLGQWRALAEPNSETGQIEPATVHLIWALLNHNDFVTVR